jgi:hypothetical protein
MKRIPQKRPTTHGKHAVALDAAQLNRARGGLDIAVGVAAEPAAYMSLQHNELMITQSRGKDRP